MMMSGLLMISFGALAGGTGTDDYGAAVGWSDVIQEQMQQMQQQVQYHAQPGLQMQQPPPPYASVPEMGADAGNEHAPDAYQEEGGEGHGNVTHGQVEYQ